MKSKINYILFFLILHITARAQNPEEIKKLYPGMDMVYTNYHQELRLFIKDNMPVAERKTDIDMLMITDKNMNMLSRYKVYHSGYNQLIDLDAYTRVPSGNKYKTYKVEDKKTSNSTDNNIFYDDLQETSFDFPGLTQNAIAHVNYTQFHKDAHLLTAFYLPGYMPVINSSFTVTFPKEISIKYIVKNDPAGKFILTETKNKKETTYKWSINNVKSEDYFADAPDSRYFEPHIIIYITSYENKQGSQPFLNSIDDLHKWNNSFLKELNLQQDPVLKKITDSVIAGEQTEKGKARKIYQWVQQHIKYVAFENGLEGFRPRQAADVCAKRYGDCKDMASIITQMLRMAGIKAYYTWIGTRSLPYTYAETPLPLVDNHMISTAFIDGKYIFLDGTDPNSRFDMPPAFIQGKEALVSINENEYKILRVDIADPHKSMITDSTYIEINDAGVKGYQSVTYKGYFGKDVYASLLYRDEEETKDYINSRMSKGSNKFILGKYKINKSIPEENIANITAEFEVPGYSKKIGNEYYINLNLEKLLENHIIDTKKRKVPWEINFAYTIQQYHILSIPDGYTVSYLPKNFTFENDLVTIKIYYTVVNQKVLAAQEIQNKKLMIIPSEFEEWNKSIKALLPHYKESVVLENSKLK